VFEVLWANAGTSLPVYYHVTLGSIVSQSMTKIISSLTSVMTVCDLNPYSMSKKFDGNSTHTVSARNPLLVFFLNYTHN